MLLFMAFSKLIPVQSLKASTWAFTSTTNFLGFHSTRKLKMLERVT